MSSKAGPRRGTVKGEASHTHIHTHYILFDGGAQPPPTLRGQPSRRPNLSPISSCPLKGGKWKLSEPIKQDRENGGAVCHAEPNRGSRLHRQPMNSRDGWALVSFLVTPLPLLLLQCWFRETIILVWCLYEWLLMMTKICDYRKHLCHRYTMACVKTESEIWAGTFSWYLAIWSNYFLALYFGTQRTSHL